MQDAAGEGEFHAYAAMQGYRFEDMSSERSLGLPWAVARAKYVPLGDTAEEVQEWRAKQVAKRKPSTFKDYCASHGRCISCESSGIVLDERRGGFKPVGLHEGVKLFERCAACEGTGVDYYVFPKKGRRDRSNRGPRSL